MSKENGEKIEKIEHSISTRDVGEDVNREHVTPCSLRYCRHKFSRRLRNLYRNLTPLEISGSLGDLGTFIPLSVAMSKERSILLPPALFFAGLANILTGAVWDVPMPVQPMKSISAVAISEGWNLATTTCSGILTGGLILIIGLSGLIELINVIVPVQIISGMQLGIGIRLMGKGMTDIAALPWVGNNGDCILTTIVCSTMAMFWLREPRVSKDTRRREDENVLVSDNSDVEGINSDSGSNESEKGKGGIIDCGEKSRRGSQRQSDGNASGSSSDNIALATERASWGWRMRRIVCCCVPGISHPGEHMPHPVGVYLFLLGCIFAGIELGTTDNADGRYDLPLRMFGAPAAVWALDGVTPLDWKVGFLEGSIPQIPLTTLNSVISVCALATALYPEKKKDNAPTSRQTTFCSMRSLADCRYGDGREKARTDSVLSRREVSLSVGLINIIMCPFGGMPNCHGAGGLAGQHRFGARSGTSVCFLGAGKIFLAVFFGASALTLLDAFPVAILGVMLAIAGGELCTTGFTLLVERSKRRSTSVPTGGRGIYDEEETKKVEKRILRQNALIAIVTASVIVALRRTDFGVLAGWVTHMVYGDGLQQLWNLIMVRRQKKRSGVKLDDNDENTRATALTERASSAT